MEPKHIRYNCGEREFYIFAFKSKLRSTHFNVTGSKTLKSSTKSEVIR